jgi:agmatinase
VYVGHRLRIHGRAGRAAEITGIAAADLVHDFLSMFLSEKPPKAPMYSVPAKDEL